MYDKNIVVIETAPTARVFRQYVDLMSNEELNAARLERPDLVFRVMSEEEAKEQQQEPIPVEDTSKGISIHGMTLPYNLTEQVKSILK